MAKEGLSKPFYVQREARSRLTPLSKCDRVSSVIKKITKNEKRDKVRYLFRIGRGKGSLSKIDSKRCLKIPGPSYRARVFL